jgi:inorganic phosphate transporter, PiT family
MTTAFIIVSVVVVAALVFDFVNGFHDAANAIATIVVSKTLTPLQAVIMAGMANFIGYFAGGTAVAKMVGKGVVHIEHVTLALLLATLMGAILWNLFTWILGLPTSSSHALIGGLIGSGIAAAGTKVVIWAGVLKIFMFIFLAPLLGVVAAILFTTITMWIFRKSVPSKTHGTLKFLQLISSASASIAHGTNDAQKTMGIIALALYVGHVSNSFASGKIDTWVIIAAYTAISLGTVCGGWRIIKTMGTSITKIRELEGFCSNAGASVVIFFASHFGIPVSTTHVIMGAIMGVGSVEHAKTVRWITARKVIWAWILTIPASATVAAISYLTFAVHFAK